MKKRDGQTNGQTNGQLPNLYKDTDTLKNLHEIDRLCNSQNLNPNYKAIIEKFTKSWLKLKEFHGTSVPNKDTHHHAPFD